MRSGVWVRPTLSFVAILVAAHLTAAQMQTRALLAALPPGPLALGADLNTWLGPVEPSARELLRHFPASSTLDRARTFAHGLLLDYLFFRAPVSWSAHYRRVPNRYGSDHHPLVAWFEATAASLEN